MNSTIECSPSHLHWHTDPLTGFTFTSECYCSVVTRPDGQTFCSAELFNSMGTTSASAGNGLDPGQELLLPQAMDFSSPVVWSDEDKVLLVQLSNEVLQRQYKESAYNVKRFMKLGMDTDNGVSREASSHFV